MVAPEKLRQAHLGRLAQVSHPLWGSRHAGAPTPVGPKKTQAWRGSASQSSRSALTALLNWLGTALPHPVGPLLSHFQAWP